MSYYTLVAKIDDKWSPQFGSHDKSDVEFEREHDSGWNGMKTKIIETKSPKQIYIDAAIAKLNGVEKFELIDHKEGIESVIKKVNSLLKGSGFSIKSEQEGDCLRIALKD